MPTVYAKNSRFGSGERVCREPSYGYRNGPLETIRQAFSSAPDGDHYEPDRLPTMGLLTIYAQPRCWPGKAGPSQKSFRFAFEGLIFLEKFFASGLTLEGAIFGCFHFALGEFVMPLIQITMLEGRTVEQKRKIVEQITKTMVEVAVTKREAVTITIVEVPTTNFASGGILNIDKK
jgi:4-oxalocrotonate tautomerase